MYVFTRAQEDETGGSLEKLSAQYFDSDKRQHGRDVFLPNGYDQIHQNLAVGLDIRYNTPVRKITYRDQPDRKVLLNTDQGDFTADFVVVTVPLGVLQSNMITFHPALPSTRTSALARLQMGSINRVILEFKTRFWPEDRFYIGVDGGTTPATRGRFSYFYCLHKYTKKPIIHAVAVGEYAESIATLSDTAVVAEVVGVLSKLFPGAVGEPVKSVVIRWTNDPFSRGAYTFAPVGATDRDFDRTGGHEDQKVWFAGEHTSRQYRGTVYGALISGLNTAQDLFKHIQSTGVVRYLFSLSTLLVLSLIALLFL
eukprot:TRINITY_DN8750_c0_g1_i5.p1 TRINITY_DN8750_c0_g1~~TRINITY_DN8750_c0_g1_i5.p1  ORF type:complete len:311 (-),score=52.68 TRINITY_DN8750_c0_g1_i5:111-1043(-)